MTDTSKAPESAEDKLKQDGVVTPQKVEIESNLLSDEMLEQLSGGGHVDGHLNASY